MQVLHLKTLAVCQQLQSKRMGKILTIADKYFSNLSLGSPADDAKALSHHVYPPA